MEVELKTARKFEQVTRTLNPQLLAEAMSANGIEPSTAARIAAGEWGRIQTLGPSWHPLLLDTPIGILLEEGRIPPEYSLTEIGPSTGLHLGYSQRPPSRYRGYDNVEPIVLAAEAVQRLLRENGFGSDSWEVIIGNLSQIPEPPSDVSAAILFSQYNGARATVDWIKQAGRYGIIGDALHSLQPEGERVQKNAVIEIKDGPEYDQPTGVRVTVGEFVDKSVMGTRFQYQLAELGPDVQRIPLGGRSDSGIMTVLDFDGQPHFQLWSWNPQNLSEEQQHFLLNARTTLYEMYQKAHTIPQVGNWDGVAIAGVPREAAQAGRSVTAFFDTFNYGPHPGRIGAIPMTMLVRHSREGSIMGQAEVLSLVGEGKKWPSYPALVGEVQERTLKPKGDLAGKLVMSGIPAIGYLLK